jgi:hypothetical protein
VSFGANVLLLLRNNKAKTWDDLCRVFGWSPEEFHTGHSDLMEALEDLKESGLITFEASENGRKYWGESKPTGEINVTAAWENIQRALGASLSDIARLNKHYSMVVRPHFRPPESSLHKHDVFVLMPFSKELQPIYDDHIKKVVDSLKLTVARADDFFTSDSVMNDVWEAICNAQILIADCTGRNPNVFYEIGLAHVLGKSVIFITQSSDDVPFDVRHIRFIEYKYTPRGMAEFEASLIKTIANTIEKTA